MLLGVAPDPALLGKATNRGFRQFVEDLFPLLTRILNPPSAGLPTSTSFFPRQDVLQILTALIENAAPSSDAWVRHERYRRGLRLWAVLLKLLPESEGSVLEQWSLRWPASLRRRFLSALLFRTRKRWPYTPYGAAQDISGRREQNEMASVYGLTPKRRRAVPQP